MSISGVGGNSSWFTQWAALQQQRSSSSAQKAAATAVSSPLVSSSTTDDSAAQVIGAAGNVPATSTDPQSFQQVMASLSQDLNAGDMGAAKSDFAKLQQLMQGSKAHGHHHHHGGAKKAGDANASASNPFASAFDALGQSLQSNDLSGAQSAFTQLDSLIIAAQRGMQAPPIGGDAALNPVGNGIDTIA